MGSIKGSEFENIWGNSGKYDHIPLYKALKVIMKERNIEVFNISRHQGHVNQSYVEIPPHPSQKEDHQI